MSMQLTWHNISTERKVRSEQGSTAQHSTAQHSTAQHSTAQHSMSPVADEIDWATHVDIHKADITVLLY